MLNADQKKQAETMYETLRKMLAERDFDFDKDDNNFEVVCQAVGDDLPMTVRIGVDAKRMLISLISQMPFYVKESRRNEMAVAVCRANCGIPDGGFDFDVSDGSIMFRMTSSYRQSLISKDLFEYMLFASFNTIDRYNDVFFRVATTDMTIDEIVKSVG